MSDDTIKKECEHCAGEGIVVVVGDQHRPCRVCGATGLVEADWVYQCRNCGEQFGQDITRGVNHVAMAECRIIERSDGR